MSLEIGCGDSPILTGEGVVYLDVRVTKAVEPLVVADAFGSLPFADGVFGQIAGHHVLEHCGHLATTATLKEWRRVLGAGGVLHLVVPNLEHYARRVVNNPGDREVARMIYGNQDYANDTNVHRTGFTDQTLRAELTDAGFRSLEVRVVGAVLVADAYQEGAAA